MKLKSIILLIILSTTISLQAQNRKVLYEIFTNSHCSSCGGAYSYFDNNIANNEANADLITIAYHLSTYSDDKLYQETKAESVPRASYYGGIAGTPTIFINGQRQSSFQNWLPNINSFRNSLSNNIPVALNVKLVDSELEITAGLNSNVDISNLNLNIVIVEDVDYQGRNGVKLHKNVMRTMPTGASGQQINLIANQELKTTKKVTLNQIWNLDKISVVAYIQNSQTKEVYNVSSVDRKDFQILNNLNDFNEYQLDEIKIYPNPSKEKITVTYHSNSLDEVEFNFIDFKGKIVATKNSVPMFGTNNFELILKDLNLINGTFTLVKKQAGKRVTNKFIVE